MGINPTVVVNLIETATVIFEAANRLTPEIQKLLPDDAADAAKDTAKKAGLAIGGAAQGAFGRVANGANEVAQAASNGMSEYIKKIKDDRELLRIIKNTKQTVLENASYKSTINAYKKLLGGSGKKQAKAVTAGLHDAPGCFVIATYKKLDNDKDFTDYIGVFVGLSEKVGEGVLEACSRNGNPDVYADVKYKQNVHVYIFPCSVEELEAKRDALVTVLEANTSYNV